MNHAKSLLTFDILQNHVHILCLIDCITLLTSQWKWMAVSSQVSLPLVRGRSFLEVLFKQQFVEIQRFEDVQVQLLLLFEGQCLHRFFQVFWEARNNIWIDTLFCILHPFLGLKTRLSLEFRNQSAFQTSTLNSEESQLRWVVYIPVKEGVASTERRH